MLMKIMLPRTSIERLEKVELVKLSEREKHLLFSTWEGGM